MKDLKGKIAYIKKGLVTNVFDTPPADYWTDVFKSKKWRDIQDVEQNVLSQPVFIIDDTNTECRVLFTNGQTGWIWKTNCILQKKN